MLVPFVLEAGNPGPMTGSGNRTYLLVSGGAAVLIDAGVGHQDHLVALDRALSSAAAALRTVAVTHGHADHASGAPSIANAHPSAAFAKYAPDAGHADPVRWHRLVDGDQIRFGNTSLAVVHTPGHSPDHVAFWHEPTRALFSGDLVIPSGSVMIDASRGGNLEQYMRSLERVLELEPDRLFPAHGARVDAPAALVRACLEHRLMRERQIVAALEAGHRTVEAIAESIYDGLDPRLMAAARGNVRAHLEKLEAQRIAANRDGWRLL
jgi:glyoxylase-like metal-dependent hydrolase (beta-lactamase superfamily II)